MDNELDGGQIDTLIALVEVGPLWDGDVPSKRGRDSLVAQGLAAHILMKGLDGYTAATYAGRDVYKRRYGDKATLREAMQWRREKMEELHRQQVAETASEKRGGW